ncbi:hypothetical protein GIB67_021176 [Kingdonia uniflora]|uniref:Uncharacterized protein n=1 Tax=Kingdonia uniflora TaxID=39325 RepID=A0A7J7N7B7_9MAGN|nr:hypothetical protein GIB67_021176 [Kingdonia uniflora]
MPPAISDSGKYDIASPFIIKASEDGDKCNEKMGIDEMLTRYCGEFGPWQLKHFVLTCLAWALEGLHTMVMIFGDREPRAWRCTGTDPGCSSISRSVCDLVPGSWEWIGGSDASTVSEWGLICGEKYKVGFVQSAFFAGCAVGK